MGIFLVLINTKQFEGLRLHVYTDSVGKKTIGYGHNLEGGSDKNILLLGLDPESLENGNADLTTSQADDLFDLDMADAHKAVEHLCPNMATFPKAAQDILNDLSFNMGIGTLSTFHRTLNDFNNEDWTAAAEDLENSLWYQQVGNRGKIIVSTLRSISP